MCEHLKASVLAIHSKARPVPDSETKRSIDRVQQTLARASKAGHASKATEAEEKLRTAVAAAVEAMDAQAASRKDVLQRVERISSRLDEGFLKFYGALQEAIAGASEGSASFAQKLQEQADLIVVPIHDNGKPAAEPADAKPADAKPRTAAERNQARAGEGQWEETTSRVAALLLSSRRV